MRAVWVDQGNDPQWETLERHGITWVYVSLAEHPADVLRRVTEIRNRGLRAGVYAAWNWYPGTSGAEFAQRVHDDLKRAVPGATTSWPKVQLDDEEHDPERIMEMLRRWRTLRPVTDTSWTFEGMQGGWMHPVFVSDVVARKVRLVPQAYLGDMQAVDSLAIARDLTRRGFPDSLISPFYDAAKLPLEWSGWAFTQGRLP